MQLDPGKMDFSRVEIKKLFQNQFYQLSRDLLRRADVQLAAQLFEGRSKLMPMFALEGAVLVL